MIKKLMYIFAFFVWTGIMSSCQDEAIVQGSDYIPEGEATINATVNFKPFGSALNGDSRTAGDAIKDIKSLYVVLYDESGKFVQMFDATKVPGYKDESHAYKVPEEPKGEHIAESNAPGATFEKTIPYGKYRIYAVANVDITKDEYSEAIRTEEGLKSIQFQWDNKTIANNNQMFGFFSDETKNSGVTKPTGFQAPTITIDSPTVSLHAWIRRLASKVTVAFDGEKLNENVYIYIHTVQIKDIPNSCYLGTDNKPTENLISNGETIYYRASSSSEEIAGLTITKGVPTGKLNDGSELNNSSEQGGVHHENANSLFFYENMAGTTSTDKGKYQDENDDDVIDYPNGDTEGDVDFKDGVQSGTYIEVKGYYVNKNVGKASQGIITYRFMMGKDEERDCNAERNYHYKLTLKFYNNANDADWHIVYEPENPTISVPTPLYISYGYNESINIPVFVRGASVDNNTTIKATITENPWGYPEHKYYNKSEHDEPNDGFLIFASPESAPIKITETQRNEDWSINGYGQWNEVKPTSVDGTVARYDIPVYTRPLILGNSLTGHNPYVSYERKAKVKFEVTLDGESIEKEIEVIQVKRLVNPTGVWRSDTNTNPFNVRLMELNEPDTGAAGMIYRDFYAPTSDGPWTAHIEKGASWVRIAETGSNDWGTDDVTGSTGSEIRFDYKPVDANTTGNVRCGVIKVTYHNNTCVHYVFVSQGNGTVELKGSKWQNRNVYAQNQLVENPLMEGSMFKFGNPQCGILVKNNHQNDYGFNQDCWGKTFAITNNQKQSFEEITYDLAGFTDDHKIFTGANANIKPASYAQWKELESLPRRYGVMYGDECAETKTTTTDAYSYWQVGHKRGMQGMFIWDNTVGKDGNHIFFPIGSTGYGHRKVNDDAYLSTYEEQNKYSLLKYAQRPLEMPEATAKAVPMYYDLWIRKGAIYWYNVVEKGVMVDDVKTDCYAHDINFHTMLLNTYGSNAIGQKDKSQNSSTDACYIRCVDLNIQDIDG